LKKFRKLIIPTVAAFGILSTSAFAATSSASITSTMTGARGGDITASNLVDVSGTNNSSSTNSLYMEVYEKNGGSDDLEKSVGTPAGKSTAYSHTVGTNGGVYYFKLDPYGPYAKGCNGSGKMVD
jgi:hypothetical protein